MVEKQSKRILPQLFSCIQKQKDIIVITLLTIRKYQSIAFCIVKLPFWNMVRVDGSRDPLVSIYSYYLVFVIGSRSDLPAMVAVRRNSGGPRFRQCVRCR